MSTADLHQLPLSLSLFLILMMTSVYFGLLSSTPGRRTWFTVVLTSVFAFLGTLSYALSFYSMLDWRVQVVVLKAADLLFIVLVSGVCLAQAGLLPRLFRRRRRRSAPLATVAARPRLRTVLAPAPWVLFASWLVATVLLFIWPVPALEAYGPAPPHFLVAILLTALPEALYAGLAGWLFLGASVRGAPSLTLRIKNLALSGGTFSWGLLALNSAALTVAQVTFPDGVREAFADGTKLAEKLLTAAGSLSFGIALTLRYVPKVNEGIVQKVYPGLLRLQDRMEIRSWRLASSGKTRRVVKASYYASEAADLLDLHEDDLGRCLKTLQLTAVMADRSDPGNTVTPDMVKELHSLHKSVIRSGDHASQLGWPKDLSGSSRLETVTSAPLHDALEASLALTSAVRDEAQLTPDRFASSDWYHLAAVAAADAGVARPRDIRANAPAIGLVRHRVLNAYRTAKDSARKNVAG